VTLLQGEDGSHTAYFWVYLRDSRSSGDMSPPAVAFRFTTGRGGKHPAAHLAGYRGYLQADGYAGYNRIDELLPWHWQAAREIQNLEQAA
jgi:hypothetical protein